MMIILPSCITKSVALLLMAFATYNAVLVRSVMVTAVTASGATG